MYRGNEREIIQLSVIAEEREGRHHADSNKLIRKDSSAIKLSASRKLVRIRASWCRLAASRGKLGSQL